MSIFNFIRQRREREAAEIAANNEQLRQYRLEREAKEEADAEAEREERARERDHQLAIIASVAGAIETMATASAKQSSETASALIEIAKSNQAQAEGFATWLKSFQMVDAPTTSVIREEDEYDAEQKRLMEHLGIPTDSEVPEELRQALELQQSFREAIRKD